MDRSKTKQPYVGMVDGHKIDHPKLIQGNRKRMKVLYLDANKNLPIRTIEQVLKLAVKLRKM